ncbi:MAG: protein kinase [Symploca sp. SIO3E6]|nr:protein kinase [Caldora sp. SIO3E6]
MSRTEHKRGTVLNEHYEIISRIGKGGQAITYLARDTQTKASTLPTLCVIKQQRHKDDDNDKDKNESVKRFQQEAKILKYFTNRNVPQIPRYQKDFPEDGEYYLVQEFIQGSTLKHILKSGQRLNKFQVIALLQDILNILRDVHHYTIDNKKIYHRDINPSNLIWQENKGHIVLIDFGITKNQHLTKTGQEPIGTPGYAPPEFLQGDVYPSSDIYSLGVTTIEALTGKRLKADSTLEGEYKKLAGDDLAVILNKMIRSKIEERYESAQQVIDALQSLNSVSNKLNQRYQIIKAINYLNQENYDALIINYTYIATDERYHQEVIIEEFCPRDGSINALQLAEQIFAEEWRKLFDIKNLNIAIPRLLDHFTESSKFYLVYDFIQGRYLSQDIALNNKMGKFWVEREIIQLLKKSLETLKILHNNNYLHLDINPSRILIEEQSKIYLTGSLKIEKIANLSSNSYTNIPPGTRDYISPEQNRGHYLPNSNLYSLGMIVIQLLTGKEPQQIKRDKDHKNLWDKKIKVQTSLKKILEKMVDEDSMRGHRYQSASEVLNDLDKLEEHGNLSSFIDKINNFDIIINPSVLRKIIGVFSLATLVSILAYLILVLVPYWQAAFKYTDGDTWLKKAQEKETKEEDQIDYYKSAEEAFDAAIKKKSDFVPALVSKAYVINQLNNYQPDDYPDEEFLFLCRSAIEHQPNFAPAYNCLGEFYKKSGWNESNPEKAIKYFEKAIEPYNDAIRLDDRSKSRFNDGTTRPLAWYNLGEVYQKLKDLEKSVEKKLYYCQEAKTAFEKALELDFKPESIEQDITKLKDEINKLENEVNKINLLRNR